MRLTQILLTPVILVVLMLVGAKVFRAQQLPLNLTSETAAGSRSGGTGILAGNG